MSGQHKAAGIAGPTPVWENASSLECGFPDNDLLAVTGAHERPAGCRFRARPSVVDWLPNLTGANGKARHQIFSSPALDGLDRARAAGSGPPPP
jgi:hypothetical protein